MYCVFILPSGGWWHQFHCPPWSRAASLPGNSERRDERWADHSQTLPARTHSRIHVSSSHMLILCLIVCVCVRVAHQWGPVFVSYGGSRSCGVHVAEQSLYLPEGNATTSVTHLETEITESLTQQWGLSGHDVEKQQHYGKGFFFFFFTRSQFGENTFNFITMLHKT